MDDDTYIQHAMHIDGISLEDAENELDTLKLIFGWE